MANWPTHRLRHQITVQNVPARDGPDGEGARPLLPRLLERHGLGRPHGRCQRAPRLAAEHGPRRLRRLRRLRRSAQVQAAADDAGASATARGYRDPAGEHRA